MLEYAKLRGISFLESDGIPDPASMLYFDHLMKQELDYILVSIDNNSYSDIGVNSLVNIPEELNVILKVDYLEGLADITRLHKITTSHKINVLLFDTKDDPEQFKAEISEALEVIDDWALRIDVNDSKVIDKWISVISECAKIEEFRPRFIVAPINPFFFPLELLDYCREREIMIATDSPYGNRFERESMFEIYTQEFLDRFSMIWTDLVFFPCNSFYRLLSSLKSSKSYRGLEVDEETEKLYTYHKSIDRKLFKTPSRLIHSCTYLSSGKVLSNYSDFNVNDKISLKKLEDDFEVGERVFEEEVSSFKIPTNAPDRVKINYLKSYIVPFLDSIITSSWKQKITSENNFIMIEVRFKINWLSRFIKKTYFIACIINGEPRVYKVQNAPEITLNSYR